MDKVPVLQTHASTIAGEIDLLYIGVTGVALFFSVLIFAAIIFLAVRYRRGNVVDRTRAPQYNVPIELAWTIIPLGIGVGIFAWAASVYFSVARVPPDAMEIYVTGKQWMWKIQHPTGRWENNTLHVPVGRPVSLIMTSEDVIHSFYIPAFRVKTDVIPGTYTRMWFTPTKTGDFHLFCAEFCGTLHSQMIGTVTVMEPAAYDQWLREGQVQESMADQGKRLFIQHGCSGCHGANSSVKAPALEGIFGREVPVQIARAGTPLEQTPAQMVKADERYLHDAIVLPEREIAAGYKPIMPSYRNRLSEADILKIVQYIKSLGREEAPPRRGRQETTGQVSPEDIKARTGFVPGNMNRIQNAAGSQPK